LSNVLKYSLYLACGCEVHTAKQQKQSKMKALVKVNGKSVGMFYKVTESETRAEMHQRILDVITYRFGACDLMIEWEF
jgi:hypothetical protein